MSADALDSVLSTFDFSQLESPDFKEDSVREEIIKPVLNALGYAASGKSKIRRSKALKHPFVKVGARLLAVIPFPFSSTHIGTSFLWASLSCP